MMRPGHPADPCRMPWHFYQAVVFRGTMANEPILEISLTERAVGTTKNHIVAVVGLLAAGTMVWGIEPANPEATPNARKVLTYRYDLPKQSENRIVSGHLAGGAVGPNLKTDGEFYRFTLKEIEYLHDVSGQWVGLIGADYCPGWYESPH